MEGSLVIWFLLVILTGVINYALGWFRYERLNCVFMRRRIKNFSMGCYKALATCPASLYISGIMIVNDYVPQWINRESVFQYVSFVIVTCFLVHGFLVYYLTNWLSTLGEHYYNRRFGEYGQIMAHRCAENPKVRQECPFKEHCWATYQGKDASCVTFCFLNAQADDEVFIQISGTYTPDDEDDFSDDFSDDPADDFSDDPADDSDDQTDPT